MNIELHTKSKDINANIKIPASKSISNRLLVIRAQCKDRFLLSNISPSDDTDVMLKAFEYPSGEINIGHAGTSMRFLTALFATQQGERILTGSERMQERPIKVLVEALQSIGADIQYINKEGFPPLKINGKKIKGGNLEIDGSISSQYITALLLIAPCLEEGLHLKLLGNITSIPYIEMTLNLMQLFGIQYKWEHNEITINKQKYKGKHIRVEADWSGASYWYEIAALANKAEIVLEGLQPNSIQGDSRIAELFEELGVYTEFINNGIRIHKKQNFTLPNYFQVNLCNQPDLAQTFAVTLCMLGIPFQLSGLHTLRIKETDRILALQNELAKFGFLLKETANGVLEWNVNHKIEKESSISIATYKDHRMAMAFAPTCLIHEKINIENLDVVSKSYPTYWKDLSCFTSQKEYC